MTDLFPFIKMHGLGNDFVIVDSRDSGTEVSSDLARCLGNRNIGIGFDQLAIVNVSLEADIWDAIENRFPTRMNPF